MGYHLHGDTYTEIIIVKQIHYIRIKIVLIHAGKIIELTHIHKTARFHIGNIVTGGTEHEIRCIPCRNSRRKFFIKGIPWHNVHFYRNIPLI